MRSGRIAKNVTLSGPQKWKNGKIIYMYAFGGCEKMMNLVAKFCDHFSVSLFLVPHMLINFCWHAACVGFRTVDEKKIFQCVNC